MTFSSFQIELDRLSVGILYVNLGMATPLFPNSTRARPSPVVRVNLTPKGADGLLSGSHKAYFPFNVRWDVWECVVVPIFEDGTTLVRVPESQRPSLRNRMNLEALCRAEGYREVLARIQKAVFDRYVACGLVPPEAQGPEGFVPFPEAPGEPVENPVDVGSGRVYTKFD
jgi:hypothetical protein